MKIGRTRCARITPSTSRAKKPELGKSLRGREGRGGRYLGVKDTHVGGDAASVERLVNDVGHGGNGAKDGEEGQGQVPPKQRPGEVERLSVAHDTLDAEDDDQVAHAEGNRHLEVVLHPPVGSSPVVEAVEPLQLHKGTHCLIGGGHGGRLALVTVSEVVEEREGGTERKK
jgi:hypothetical protein